MNEIKCAPVYFCKGCTANVTPMKDQVPEQWVPKDEETYFTIDFEIWQGTWENNPMENNRIKRRNIFKTREELEVALNKIFKILEEQ